MNRKIISISGALLLAAALCAQPVRTGLDVLRESGFEILEGKRVGLVTNPSGVDSKLKSTIDILLEAPDVNLVALFGPEHGIRGDIWAGGRVESGKDPLTGLPVFSLYGATRKPTPQMLEGIDVMVYDIQDVGTRSYTFISTLGLVMRACAEKGIPVVVLDRPNPLGGLKVEGPLVEDGFHSFVGQYKIPYVYGLTVGELAQMINEEGMNRGQKGNETPLKCNLTVIPMRGWKRSMTFDRTGLPWVAPSPNIPYPQSAISYAAAGLCGELYNYLNIGIGYTMPFATFAEVWVDADSLKTRLESYALPGVSWRCIHYTPFYGRLARKLVHGVQPYFTDYESATITLTQFYVMQAVKELWGKEGFKCAEGRTAMFDKVCGNSFIRATFGASYKVGDILNYWNKDVAEFRKLSEKYYLYH